MKMMQMSNDIKENYKISIVNGDILNAPETYIVHQCNCTTLTSAGLAKSINKKYPWADIYSTRKKQGTFRENIVSLTTPDIPGTIKIQSNPFKTKHVICMFAQYSPGKISYNTTSKKISHTKFADTSYNRSKWFTQCLDAIAKELPFIKTFAFPYKIGCGLAGGDWELYLKHLSNFARLYKRNVIIYKLEN